MKNKIMIFLFMGYLIIFAILHIIFVDEVISKSERRNLATIPTFELTNEYGAKMEKYLLDQFPYRDTFRSIKAIFNYRILNRLENNGIFLKDNYIFKSNYPTDSLSVDNFIAKTLKINDLFTDRNDVYIMIVPDKNYYLDDELFLKIDYDYIYDRVDDLNFINIDIRDMMKLDDYYETDTHWRQENLDKVINRMSEYMNFNYNKKEYTMNEYNYFYGVYYGEGAIERKADKLVYLTDKVIDNARVYYLENEGLKKVYNVDKLTSLDSYQVYLDGASAYIEIYNDNCNNERELIIFRDSFASSLIPLLIDYYSKITVIDNRYINSDSFLELVDFNDQDILFLYSSLIVNMSGSLKG